METQRKNKPTPCPAEALNTVTSVLDLGCGWGAMSNALELRGDAKVFGLDYEYGPMLDAIHRGTNTRFVQGNAMQLPYTSNSFDYIVSGVALPLMDIPTVLREIHRVLKPGGRIWASLHPFAFAWHDFKRAVRLLSWRNLIFRPYVFLNGFYFHFTGRTFRFPLKRIRCESFQTQRGMQLAFEAAGLEVIEMRRWGWYFTVLAKSPNT